MRRSNTRDTDLLAEAQAPEEERHAQDEQQVGQDRAEQRGLDDPYFIFDEGNASRVSDKSEW
jgi:hypothetical protein